MPPAASPLAALPAAAFAGSLKRHALLIAIFAAALLLRSFLPTNADTSWLLTVGEKILDGSRPYVDLLEVNPPASILLYLLPVWLSRVLPLSAEFFTGALVFAAAAGCLWFASRILLAAQLFNRDTVLKLTALFAAVVLLLPAQTFAQREHIALILFLPALATYVVRANGSRISLREAVMAGLLAGITVAIKPHLVFGMMLASFTASLYARDLRTIFAIENWAAVFVCALYAALVIVFYPAFVADILPLVSAVYVPVRADFWKFLVHFATPIFALAAAAIFALTRSKQSSPAFAVLLASAFGFAISYYAQFKGWAYHSFPMLALIVAAAVIAFARRWPQASGEESAAERFRRLASALFIALLAGASFLWFSFFVDMRGLNETVAKAAPRGTLLSISSDIAVGHPLARQVGGTWVGRVCSQWIAAGALALKLDTQDPAARAKLDAYEMRDRAMLLEDIRNEKPGIILVDRIGFDWLKWAQADAEIAHELEKYRSLDQINGVLILRRK